MNSTGPIKMIPYGHQCIDEEDIASVCSVLRSDWLTTGPKVAKFEEAFARYVGARYAVAVSSGTAALHSAMYALHIKSGEEVIVSPMTFAATANSVVYMGGTPVFADVHQDTLLMDPLLVEKKITRSTRAVISVDYAGQPCDYDLLKSILQKHGLPLIADGCHALGAEYKGCRVGSLADMTVFSFHPVKHIATGEGGMITTDSRRYAERLRLFRNHGITSDFRDRESRGEWQYDMVDLGFNYRITDIQCALGLSQLGKLPRFLERRREIAKIYDKAFGHMPGIEPLAVMEDILHAYHLYVIRLEPGGLKIDRAEAFKALREKGIGVNVHYKPVHLHSYYRKRFGTGEGACPAAENAYGRILSLPIFPAMTDWEVKTVIQSLAEVVCI